MERYTVQFKYKDRTGKVASTSTIKSTTVSASSRAEARGKVMAQNAHIGGGITVLSVVKL